MTTVAETTQTVVAGYNGWSNRETWIVSLWLTNTDYLTDSVMQRITNDCNTIDDIAEQIMELATLEPNSLWSDLVYIALTRVNWREIAEAMG